jgi:hypothetical protein
MDMDAAGGVVTGGVIAGAVEKPTGHAGHTHDGRCSDCGAAVDGKFCAECGQPTHVHRTLLHLFEEILHGVMHFDARIWRTLPLLAFNPGRLTREWVQGKRTRYVSPLALFLFTIFLTFFILSFAGGGLESAPPPVAERIQATEISLTSARAALAELRAQKAADPDVPGIDGMITGATATVTGLQTRLTALRSEQAGGERADGLAAGSWQAELRDMTASGDASDRFSKNVLKKLQNPDLAVYKLQQTVYKFAFLLVPFSIPFVALLFLWKRGFTLYDHGVFVLYSLTFICIASMGVAGLYALSATLGGLALTGLSLWIPVHMFFQLKGAYGLLVFSALWRTFALLIFCNIVIAFFLIAIVYLGLGV